VSACLLVPAVATAEPPSRPPNRGLNGAAETDPLRRGRAARAARRWADAEAALEAALETDDARGFTPLQRAEVMGEIGLCELEQRKHREAAEHLSEALDQFLKLRPAQRRSFNDALAEAIQHVGRVFFSADPPDAAVLLDGKPVGRAGVEYELFVDPGKHMIRARLNGYQDVVQVFDISAGQSHQISMNLPRAPAPAAVAAAGKSKPVASTPASVETSSRWPWLPLRIAGGVLAVGAAVTGGILLSEADATREELDAQRNALLAAKRAGETEDYAVPDSVCLAPSAPSDCVELAEMRRRQVRLTDAGWVTLGAGGVIGVLTLVSFVRVPRSRSKGGLDVTPMVAQQQVGIMVQGAW
jgi:tetratricopeptide (TPR) repeat protein